VGGQGHSVGLAAVRSHCRPRHGGREVGTTHRCRSWRPARARPSPDGFGSTCATNVRPVAGRRRLR
jgi:hypothetical protein